MVKPRMRVSTAVLDLVGKHFTPEQLIEAAQRRGVSSKDAAILLDIMDESAFTAAKNCRNERITTHKQLVALLKKLTNDTKGIRRVHHGQHLYVHAGDWHRWHEEQDRRHDKELRRVEAVTPTIVEELRAQKAAKKIGKSNVLLAALLPTSNAETP
jgi:hypothetical protein